MKLLTVDTLESARSKMIEALSNWTMSTEKIHITKAFGRVLSEDIYSDVPVPSFRRSTVDGYAVKSANTYGASESIPVFLEVIEEIQMGEESKKKIKDGECAYVPTGGMIPEGADAMVMIEYTEIFDDCHIAVYQSVGTGNSVVGIGEDFPKGECISKKGTCIRPQEIGALVSAGIIEIEVFKPMKISIISTGDELVDLNEEQKNGQVRDINTYTIEAMAKKQGLEVVNLSVVKDEEKLIREKVLEGMKSSDFVVVSGGSSQGDRDYTAKIMDGVSDVGVFTHGIALKPGKPTIVGYDSKTRTVLIGLPGHPVAAMMVFELLCIWTIEKLMGMKKKPGIQAVLESNVFSAPGRATLQLVEIIEDGDIYRAKPIFKKSGLITSLTKADGYTIIEVNKEGLRPGEKVSVHLF